MAKMVVSVFDSRPAAEAARERLLARGFEDMQIRVEGGENERAGEGKGAEERDAGRAEDRGLSGVIERMFSGLLLDDDAAQYARAARGGKTVVAVRAADEAAAKAAAILGASAGEIGRPMVSDDAPPPAGEDRGTRGRPGVEPAATLSRTRVYPLPNAPTGWGEATQGEKSAIDPLTDPARPDGLIEDAQGLGADDYRRVMEARRKAAEGAKGKR